MKDVLIVFKDYVSHKQNDDDVEDVEGDDQEEPGQELYEWGVVE